VAGLAGWISVLTRTRARDCHIRLKHQKDFFSPNYPANPARCCDFNKLCTNGPDSLPGHNPDKTGLTMRYHLGSNPDMLNWEKECPELWAMHGPHLAPTYRMAEGQEKEAVAELLRLLKGSGMKLVKSKGEVMLDIKNPELAANNAGQAKKDRKNNEAIL
jgi:hypothetical protein